jgi:predicted nucleotide-binding protein
MENTQIEKLRDLLKMGHEYSYENFSIKGEYGYPSALKAYYRSWLTKTEHLLKIYLSENSISFKLFSQAYTDGFIGNGEDKFEIIHGQILGAIETAVDTLDEKTRILTSSRPKNTTQTVNVSSQASSNLDTSQVFIVHGHDEEALEKTARFIEKLGFTAIILREQPSSSKTIIEKIEEYSNVGFGIVLYTPCDTGAKKEAVLTYKDRARQNVVFEHGYLIGKISRSNVCALVKGDVEKPNDISGVVYVSMDMANAWQMRIARELSQAGYSVDMNKLK